MASQHRLDDFVESFGYDERFDLHEEVHQSPKPLTISHGDFFDILNMKPGSTIGNDQLQKEMLSFQKDTLMDTKGENANPHSPDSRWNHYNYTSDIDQLYSGINNLHQQGNHFGNHIETLDSKNIHEVDKVLPKLDMPFNEDLLSSRDFDIPTDPVINIVAPEEVPPLTHFHDDAYPMYSVDGRPIGNNQVPEFIKNTTNFVGSNGPYLGGTQWGINTLTPYGTPLSSPYMVPQSATTSDISPASSFIGSPVTQDGFGSPHITDDPFIDDEINSFIDEAISDLSDSAVSKMYDCSAVLTPYQSRTTEYRANQDFHDLKGNDNNTSLSVSRHKIRALSDSFIDKEKVPMFEEPDMQSHHIHQIDQPVEQESSSPLLFPPYPATNKDPCNNLNQTLWSETGSKQFANYRERDGGCELSKSRSKSSCHSNVPESLIPNATRLRSHSNPFEPTHEFKTSSLSSSSSSVAAAAAVSQLFKCELCNKRFTRAYNLRSHMRTHTDERPYSCQFCGKSFARQHDKKRHEALHSGEKKFVCYGKLHDIEWGCRKRFARADALGRHFRTEAGKNCLRPLVDRIYANGDAKEKAPEGILFRGVINSQPQLTFDLPERDINRNGIPEEKEDQTRRTVIITAVAEILHEILVDEDN